MTNNQISAIFWVLSFFSNEFKQCMKSDFTESKDHLKSNFCLKVKTIAVTRSYAHDFEKNTARKWPHIRHREKAAKLTDQGDQIMTQ